MTVRQLTPEEWPRLLRFPELAGVLPDPSIAIAVVAEQDGEIVGYCFAQPQICVEPIFVEPGDRSGVVAYALWHRTTEILRGQGVVNYMTHAADEAVAGYLVRLGMKPTGWQAFQGSLEVE